MTAISEAAARSVATLRERAAAIGWTAVGTVVLPAALRDALSAYGPDGAAGAAARIASVLVLPAAIWGSLTIAALAADPPTTPMQARRAAARRLVPVTTAVLAMAAAIIGALLPFWWIMTDQLDPGWFPPGRNGVDVATGEQIVVTLYLPALALLATLLASRLLLFGPAMLGGAGGLDAVRRSWRLTRGRTWRLVGVVLFGGIMFGVACEAALTIVGLVALPLGRHDPATPLFLAELAMLIALAAMGAVASVFVAHLHDVLRAEPPAR